MKETLKQKNYNYEIQSKHKKAGFYCDSSQTLKQVVQRAYRVSTSENIQSLTGQSPRQPALSCHCLSRGFLPT